MAMQQRSTNAERVARRRATLRAQGLRPKQFWLPDMRDEAFLAQLRQECLAIAASDEEAEVMRFIEAVTDWDSLPPYDAPLPE